MSENKAEADCFVQTKYTFFVKGKTSNIHIKETGINTAWLLHAFHDQHLLLHCHIYTC